MFGVDLRLNGRRRFFFDVAPALLCSPADCLGTQGAACWYFVDVAGDLVVLRALLLF
jgi:hypothetical protein